MYLVYTGLMMIAKCINIQFHVPIAKMKKKTLLVSFKIILEITEVIVFVRSAKRCISKFEF